MDSTTTNATPDELRARIESAEAAIKEANSECWRARSEAESVCAAAKAPHEQMFKGLIKQFRERAMELAIEDGSCPHERWGSHMDPHDITARPDGLWLTWDINGDYAPASFLATWDALLAPVAPASTEEAES